MSEPEDHIANNRQRSATDPRTTEELIADALVDLESDQAGEAVSVLHERGTIVELRAAQELCADPDSDRRELGVKILRGWIEDLHVDESLASLIPLLDDVVPDVASEAAVALGFGRDRRALGPLLAHMDHWDSSVRWGVASALSGYSDPEAIAALITLSRDESIDVRNWATFGLRLREEVDTPALRQALIDRLDDEDGEVRGEAMIGLARRHDPHALPAVRAELALEELDGDWAFEAAEILADPSLYADLLRFNENPPWKTDSTPIYYLVAALKACRPANIDAEADADTDAESDSP
ncbi:MAG: HEAT repeat domain-containing protein [Planctomycetota bacterium]|nr:HEAT repeat domain-containing protein [Planctomycetota bacterium]